MYSVAQDGKKVEKTGERSAASPMNFRFCLPSSFFSRMIKASPATLNNASQRATVYNMNTPEREKSDRMRWRRLFRNEMTPTTLKRRVNSTRTEKLKCVMKREYLGYHIESEASEF